MTDTGTVPIFKEQIIINNNTQIILLGMANLHEFGEIMIQDYTDVAIKLHMLTYCDTHSH